MNFRLKQFEISHSASTMKVGTDAILLGGVLNKIILSKYAPNNILDIGTGSGILALIAAQRFENAKIIGIDIDKDSCNEAASNFISSPWCNRLSVQNISLQNYYINVKTPFELVISNPPFFENSLKSPDINKTKAHHTENLPFATLCFCVSRLLDMKGYFTCIIPENEEKRFITIALTEGLYCNEIIKIFSQLNSVKPKRLILLFSKLRQVTIEKAIHIGDANYKYIVEDLLL